jgi:hypothetical protein
VASWVFAIVGTVMIVFGQIQNRKARRLYKQAADTQGQITAQMMAALTVISRAPARPSTTTPNTWSVDLDPTTWAYVERVAHTAKEMGLTVEVNTPPEAAK